MKLIVLRPAPGNAATARRARERGLDPLLLPLFRIEPVAWRPPAEEVGAVMLTSANAVRSAGAGLSRFVQLPCYAVGGSTAEAAADFGFGNIATGGDGVAALVRMMARDRIECAFHPCGRHYTAVAHWPVEIVRRVVYEAVPLHRLPAQWFDEEAVVLLHSARAAREFANLVEREGRPRERISIAALSAAVAAAAGEGWLAKAHAAEPRDDALLELAAKLCQTDQRTK